MYSAVVGTAIFFAYANFAAVDSYKILAVLPMPAKSHYAVPDRLLVRLAEKGHNVTVYSAFPKNKIIPNYRDVDTSACFPVPKELLTMDMMNSMGSDSILSLLMLVAFASKLEDMQKCEPLMQLLNSTEKYDLLVVESFFSDWTLVYAEKFKLPYINVIPNVLMPWLASRVGNPDNPSYMPNIWDGKTPKMNFWERTKNTLAYLLSNLVYEHILLRNDNYIAQTLLGSTDLSLYDLVKDGGVIFSSSHPALNMPVPLVPGVIQIGGIHIKDAAALPKVCFCCASFLYKYFGDGQDLYGLHKVHL